MEDNLRGLEILMMEFFSEGASNERKREIESLLSRFQSSEGAWREASYFMTHTQNQYVCMFAINTLQSIIEKQWVLLQVPDKTEIRSTISGILKEHNASTPPFIRNKLIKLLVNIARTDWPHFYPDFTIKNIYEPLQQEKSLLLGLSTLLIASEELATPRDENVYTLRKKELKKLMNDQVPEILRSLHAILLKILCKMESGGPNCSHPNSRSHRTFSALSGTSVQAETRSGSLKNDNEIAELALRCLAHLFSWISLSSVGLDLTDLLFRYARLNTSPQEDLGCHAMNCINEIVYSQFVPDNYQSFFLHIFKNAFSLLGDLMNGGKDLGALDETYLKKFTELFRSFVHIHIRRFHSNPQFPMMDFLSLLFKYSFQQPHWEGFFACLEVWGLFIDFVGTSPARVSHDSPSKTTLKSPSAISSNDGSNNPYAPPLIALAREILKKLSFKVNESQLNQLNNSIMDDDNMTEWQIFLNQCIEILMKVAGIIPNEVFRLLDNGWKEYSSVYLHLSKYIQHSSLVLPNEAEYIALHSVLRDFSSYLQIMGRISSFTIGEHFSDQLSIAGPYMKQLIELASFGSQGKLYELKSPYPPLAEAFIDVQAQTLAALKAWCHWLAQLHREALKEPLEGTCRELTSTMVISVIPILKSGNNEKLTHAAAHLLVTLTGTVRPPSIWKLKEFTELFNDLPRLRLLPDAERLMVRALSNVLLLSWPGIADQRWEEREGHLKKFLGEVTLDFGKLAREEALGSIRETAKPVALRALRILGDLVEHILNEVTQSKKLIHDVIKGSIHTSFRLFPLYLGDSTMSETLLSFFLIVFDVLKSQMGADYVEKSIQTLLSIFNKEQLQHVLSTDQGSGLKVVEKFLQILEFVVKEPDSSFRKFIPLALSLCLDHICPVVIDKSSSDLKSPLYSLLFETLYNNWQYFFKSSVVRCLVDGGAASKSNNDLKDQSKELFLRVMEVFGRSFLQPDISIFKQNLLSLEKLHGKWKLYEKSIFVETLITPFLTVLLQVLIHRSHDLLREEIVTAVYNMASVDLNAFFSGFLQVFLSGMEGINDQQRETLRNNFACDSDFPTFKSSADRFINDFRYYRICNHNTFSQSQATMAFI